MKNPKLALYFFPSCPFCQFVLQAIYSLQIKVELINIHEDINARDKLYNDTGRHTVPCLYIDENPMHESSDIIAWLKDNQETLEKAQ